MFSVALLVKKGACLLIAAESQVVTKSTKTQVYI